jgi:hypothetical protein
MSIRTPFVLALLGLSAIPAFAQPTDQTPPSPDQPPTPPPEPAPNPNPNPNPNPTPMPSPEPMPMPKPEAKPAENTGVVAKGKTEISLYGFVQLYGIYDSTQGLNEQMQNTALQRPGTYTGNHGQSQLSARHSRLGLKISQPVVNDIKATGQFELDFLGNQPSNPPTTTENAFYQNATMRFRHVFAKVETPAIDVVVGQWWSLFGWSSYFHPNSVEIMGLPGQAYKRTPQIRLDKVFKSDAVDVEIAVSAQRPPERASATPDGLAGLNVKFNKLKAWRTRGANDSGLDSGGIGVSAIGRRFAADEFSATPSKQIVKNGYGFSVDAMFPIVPASKESHANALTITGSFVQGAGIEDQYDGLTFGVANPNLPNPTMANPAPAYTNNIDPGMIMFVSDGMGGFALHPIQLQSYMVGLQYYLPPSGHVWVSGNFTHISSGNAANFGNTQKIWNAGTYFDVNIFADLTPGFRIGALYSRNDQTFVGADMANKTDAPNNRFSITALYLF